MRQITTHKINETNDKLEVWVVDEPGSGGACHEYVIQTVEGQWPPVSCKVNFQNGPIGEVGVNGITHEALLAIIIDRMQDFQAGPFACQENALALSRLQEAQNWLLERTKSRMLRGVEGTHKQ